MNVFDMSVYAIRRRAGRSRSKSFLTRRLADSYRAELVRAARLGLEFDPLTGEPTAVSSTARRAWTPSDMRPLCVRGRRVPGSERSTDRCRTGHGRARTGPRTRPEKVTDGAGGSGYTDRQPGFLPLTWHFRVSNSPPT